MNVFELMDLKVSSFSKTDRLIYNSVRKFPEQFAEQSITEISENSGFSKPALSRFAKKLGFGGYAEFQYQFSQELKERKAGEKNTSNADIYGTLLKQVEQSVSEDTLEALLDRMRGARKVLIFGTNLSRMPAELLHLSLQFEKDITAVILPGDIPPMHHSKDDLYLFFSAQSGTSHQNLMKELRKEGAERPYMVLVTTNSKHPLRHNFDEVIVLPSLSLAAGNQIVYSDTFAFMMFNDMILGCLHR